MRLVLVGRAETDRDADQVCQVSAELVGNATSSGETRSGARGRAATLRRFSLDASVRAWRES